MNAISQAISEIEGYQKPGSVANRLNNPGNLIFKGQPGAKPNPVKGADGMTRTFARFATPEAGEAALDAQVERDAARGLTIAQLAQKWLGWSPKPTAEGDPQQYANLISRKTGFADDLPVARALRGDTTEA